MSECSNGGRDGGRDGDTEINRNSDTNSVVGTFSPSASGSEFAAGKVGQNACVTSISFMGFTQKDRENVAVVEINEPGIYSGDGTPRDHGVMSAFLGVTSSRVFCRTCKQTERLCPGHMGIIQFARPVIAALFRQRIVKTLRVLCYYCSALIADRSRLPSTKALRNMSAADAWSAVDRVRRLPSCPGCLMTVQPQYKLVGQAVTAVWPSAAKWASPEHERHCKAPLTTTKIRQILLHVHADVVTDVLRMSASPADMFTPVSMLVPPVQARAAVVVRGVRRDSDVTRQLAEIVRHNEQLRAACNAEADLRATAEPSTPTAASKRCSQLTEYAAAASLALDRLQQACDVFQDRDYGGAGMQQSRKRTQARMTQEPSCVRSLGSKEGMLRKNLVGNRLNNSARAVVSCDPRMPPTSVGVPFCILRELTVPEAVSDLSAEGLRNAVRRGVGVNGGAHSIEWSPGYTISLKGLSGPDRDSLAGRLAVGMVVHRQVRDGDPVLVNRQPSLHKYSMLCQRVRGVDGVTIRQNDVVCLVFNLDFDGDEMNITVPQTMRARAECEQLASPTENCIHVAKNTPNFDCIQDVVGAAWLLTQQDRLLRFEDFCNIVCALRSPTREAPSRNDVCDDSGRVAGRKVFDYLFPPTFQYHDGAVHVVDGRLTPGSGPLRQRHVGASASSMLLVLHKDFGAARMLAFVFDAGLAADVFLHQVSTISVGLKDMLFDDSSVSGYQAALCDVREQYAAQTESADKLLALMPLVVASEAVVTSSTVYSHQGNGFATMIDSGARGSKKDVIHIALGVGQQIVVDDRPARTRGRLAACFSRSDASPEADGFVSQSYLQGLSCPAFFVDCLSGRAGIGTTACTTSELGYNFRRMYALMSSMIVDVDGTVRCGGDRNVVAMTYGDGFNPDLLERAPDVDGRLFVTPPPPPPSPKETKISLMLETLRSELATGRRANSRNPNPMMWVPLNWHRRIWDARQRGSISCRCQQCFAPPERAKVRQLVAAVAERLLAMTNVQGQQQAYNALDAALHGLLLGDEAPCCAPYGVTPSSGATAALVRALVDDTLMHVHKAAACAGLPAGSVAAFAVSEPCTQAGLKTLHRPGEKHATTKDLVRSLLLLAHRPHAVVTVHISPVSELAGNRPAVRRAAKALLPLRIADLLVIPASSSGSSVRFAAKCGAECGSPAMRRGMARPHDTARPAWQLDLSAAAMRSAGVSVPVVVGALLQAMPSGTLVWPMRSLSQASEAAAAFTLFVQPVARAVAYTDAAADPVALFHRILVRGFPSVHSVSVTTATAVTTGEPTLCVRARVESLDPFFTPHASASFDMRTLRCACPLVTTAVYGIEAGRARLVGAFEKALQMRVHPRHLGMIAAFLTCSGRIIKLDRFDMLRVAENDTLQCATFESTKSVLMKAALHGTRTDNIPRAVISATIMGVAPICGTGIVEVVVAPHLEASALRAAASAGAASAVLAGNRRGGQRRPCAVFAEPCPSCYWDLSMSCKDQLQALKTYVGNCSRRRRRRWTAKLQLLAGPESGPELRSRLENVVKTRAVIDANLIADKPETANLPFAGRDDDEFAHPQCTPLPLRRM